MRNANPGGDMKINNEQLAALLRQQEQSAGAAHRPAGQGAGFGAALAEQLGLGAAGASSAAGAVSGGQGMQASQASQTSQASQASMISQMLLGVADENPDVNPHEDVLQEAFNQASGTLDMWESYVGTLGDVGKGGSLRDAYALLQGIDGQVNALKENTAGLRGQNPGLDTLVNNLEVLATTEKFKFNRGDYNV